MTHISYVRTRQGWLYLAVVMDLFSRRTICWTTSATTHREVVLDAVMMAVKARRTPGTLVHSDQGTQYGCDVWRRFRKSDHHEPSMSRKGNCWANAVAESFFRSLKKELIKKYVYKNRELATQDDSDYIKSFYDRTRRNSRHGGVSPGEIEASVRTRRRRKCLH